MALRYHPDSARRPFSQDARTLARPILGNPHQPPHAECAEDFVWAFVCCACVNLVMGTIIVWALVRYRFPGRRLFDAIVDIPFALPTAVAGVALTALFAQKGWLGAPLAELGIKVAFTPIGIFIAMVFIGIPFVVRTVQPVLLDLDAEIEEAAASLGANRLHTVSRVILPSLTPAMLTGF